MNNKTETKEKVVSVPPTEYAVGIGTSRAFYRTLYREYAEQVYHIVGMFGCKHAWIESYPSYPTQARRQEFSS